MASTIDLICVKMMKDMLSAIYNIWRGDAMISNTIELGCSCSPSVMIFGVMSSDHEILTQQIAINMIKYNGMSCHEFADHFAHGSLQEFFEAWCVKNQTQNGYAAQFLRTKPTICATIKNQTQVHQIAALQAASEL
jgi:hypothetical protein